MRFSSLSILFIITFLAACTSKPKEVFLEEVHAVNANYSTQGLPKLSDYGFFTGELRDLRPAKDVVAYDVNSPLFSDYASKKRFIYIPEGKKIGYDHSDVFKFPEGSVLIKNFFYSNEDSGLKKQILETRLLILDSGKWKALPYVWNDEQTEAFLQMAGDEKMVTWKKPNGQLQKINYAIPNETQCKNCHTRGDQLMPIGPTARQLNKVLWDKHQLVDWAEQGILEGLPSSRDQLPLLADYEDQDIELDLRARSWLESNCAHCHREDGPAKTSGLHLLANESSPLKLGIGKPPIAAGKGSGGRKYDIVPGSPENSILLFRILSTDPGIMMPELGRKMVHEEGANLIRQWIKEMK